MLSTLAAIGFDPQIRGILVVGVGAIVLMGSVWMILATNSGIRLGALIALAGFFGWMVIMGAFWWIRGIGYVGESVSWHILDYNRGAIAESSVDIARDLPDPKDLQGKGYELAVQGFAEGEETLGEFVERFDPAGPDAAELSPDEIADAITRQDQRNEATTLSQVFSVNPDYVEAAFESGGLLEGSPLNGWQIMNTAEAGEAQSAASAGVLEQDGFEFGASTDFKFLDAFRIGGKPRISRDNDPDCTFCVDNLERGWHWIANSARIRNPPEYAAVQLQAISAEALIPVEGQAPAFPAVDEDAPIITVVMIRELGNLRFPPAMVTLGSLFIFLALCYMLHLRDLETMKRVEEFEAAS